MIFSIFKKSDVKKEKSLNESVSIKYQKPKILLIDLPVDCIDKVKSAGFNASCGTFGSPYKVVKDDQLQPLIGKPILPNFTEQEVIFIDLTPPELIENPEYEKDTSDGENDWWCKRNLGRIDPRPKYMTQVQDQFDLILKHGGLFVIFAQPRLSQKLFLGNIRNGYFNEESKLNYDNWSFLSIFNDINIFPDYGIEINVPNHDHQIYKFLRKSIKNAEYNANFEPKYSNDERVSSILTNKYGKHVGALIRQKTSKGFILVLPQISNKPDAVVILLREVLPDISPHLFPHIEGIRWIERDEYELDSVLKFKEDKIKVQQRAKNELEEIENKISKERDKLGFLHGIIIKTGSDLVVDVKSCLELIGFNQIIDVDEQIKKQKNNTQKQEDIQIRDKSPALLIEIKGISSLPQESDTIQVVKYIPRRKREWGRTDVRGVSIINHQRNIQALERENKNVFSDIQIEDAKSHNITIMTTWDLFLLIKGMLKWNWNPKVIQELFYKSGRMSKFPTNYRLIGHIEKYWEDVGVIGFKMSENGLSKGDRIGYVTESGYFEQDVLSIQVNEEDVEDAFSGQLVGIKTNYPTDILRKGTPICKVIKRE